MNNVGSVIVTIKAGQAVSDAVDIGANTDVALLMSSGWDTASLSYLASSTLDGTYIPVYKGGTEVKETVAASQCVIASDALKPLQFIKLRSGAVGAEVVQTADRVIALSLKR